MELSVIIEKAKSLGKFKKVETPVHVFSINDILPDFGLRNIIPNLSIVLLLVIGILFALKLACQN